MCRALCSTLKTIEQVKKITFQKKYTISGTFGILSGMRNKALISGTVGHPNFT
jgi:hypothetical protein